MEKMIEVILPERPKYKVFPGCWVCSDRNLSIIELPFEETLFKEKKNEY